MNPYRDDPYPHFDKAADAYDAGTLAERERIATWLTTTEARQVLLEALSDGPYAGLAAFADYVRTQ